ncbi:MAG TPA: DNA polymerase IV [Saprospiraceae bacterium]|nr:DNA polymerase IV [Saprospiraceae bacterium]
MRSVLHLDLDSFFVSVEQLKNSSLKGKPLIVGGTSNRGVVAACSYEARAFGVHSAMPIRMAKRLCPQALILRGDYDSYIKYSQEVTDLIEERAPLFEKSSIDEFYCDLTGMDKYFGCMKWSTELRNSIIKETGLPISFGLSVNKIVSKVGTNEAKPNGTINIPTGTEKSFLAPLSTNKMPGIGKETYKRLSFMGVRTIKLLSEIPVRLLEREFGEHGQTMWEHANGIDYSPVISYREAKSISKEQTFEQDTLDMQKMRLILLNMTEKLAFELRDSNRLTSVVTVKIRYADFNTYSKQMKISYTALDKPLWQTVQRLFDKLYERRQLIRLIGVKFGGLAYGNSQFNLFEDTAEQISLLKQVDHIRHRWGYQAIQRAVHDKEVKQSDKAHEQDEKK